MLTQVWLDPGCADDAIRRLSPYASWLNWLNFLQRFLVFQTGCLPEAKDEHQQPQTYIFLVEEADVFLAIV